ncbi:hypothetical protein GCM10023321_63000 [Pseudonocardia eucalypti]|uniref:Uncharacterized protein n=1 Tax=Pseudonocardia eucalypti TaxID=648755 RepID=A0ABP9QWV0_9PSEU|nr:hypothetical protein [Pseudonocardia eucalypti]
MQRWTEAADAGPSGVVAPREPPPAGAAEGGVATQVRAQVAAVQGWGGAERMWRGIVLGAMPVWAAFYGSYLLQLFWYAAAEPWTTPYLRPF